LIQNMDILETLTKLEIEFELFKHEAFRTCEDSRSFYEGREGGDSKNLFIRDRKGKQHYLIVLQADKRLDLKALSLMMGDRFSFASEERLWKWLKVKPGAVSPLNLIFDEENHVKVFIDKDLLKFDRLYYHPGTNTQTVALSKDDLIKYLDASGNEWSEFNVPVSQKG